MHKILTKQIFPNFEPKSKAQLSNNHNQSVISFQLFIPTNIPQFFKSRYRSKNIRIHSSLKSLKSFCERS